MKTFQLVSLYMVLASAINAQEIKCTPTEESKWTAAEIEPLKDGAQAFLYHVKAYGPYRVADLICNYDECFGFVNGIKATGTIESTTSRPLEILSLSLEEKYSGLTKFTCK